MFGNQILNLINLTRLFKITKRTTIHIKCNLLSVPTKNPYNTFNKKILLWLLQWVKNCFCRFFTIYHAMSQWLWEIDSNLSYSSHVTATLGRNEIQFLFSWLFQNTLFETFQIQKPRLRAQFYYFKHYFFTSEVICTVLQQIRKRVLNLLILRIRCHSE